MSAPVKKCEVCDDTGSKSRDLSGDLDCTSCDAADARVFLRYLLAKQERRDLDGVAWLAYQHGKAAADPVAPVEAQPVAWGLLSIQEPELTNDQGLADYWARKGRIVTALYAAPSLEAQPAGQVVIMPKLLTPGMKLVLKEVAPKWNAESIYANLYDAAAMAQGEKHGN